MPDSLGVSSAHNMHIIPFATKMNSALLYKKKKKKMREEKREYINV